MGRPVRASTSRLSRLTRGLPDNRTLSWGRAPPASTHFCCGMLPYLLFQRLGGSGRMFLLFHCTICDRDQRFFVENSKPLIRPLNNTLLAPTRKHIVRQLMVAAGQVGQHQKRRWRRRDDKKTSLPLFRTALCDKQ